ncbi:MAG: DUF6807 family protein [Phycisphaeraceae bacterium]
MMRKPSVIAGTVALLIGLTAWCGTAAAQGPAVELDHDRAKGTIDVHIGGELFTTYHYGRVDGGHFRTPMLWPVMGEGGVGLTRNYPMAEDAIEDADHPHHRSLFFLFGDVNGYDHWHKETIATRRVETGEGDGYAWIRSYNDWLDSEGEPVVREVQELRFNEHAASGRRIDLITRFEADYGPVTFDDYKEGLMGLRIRPELRGEADGVLTNARGEQGERAVYGEPAAWMDYAGPLEGHGWRGIAIFDHPDNFRQGYWHARDYGLLALNPFSRQGVGGRDESGSYTLEEDETLTLRYAWYIHSGNHEEADLAGAHQRFVEEVQADDGERPVRALLVTGGGWHDYEAQHKIITKGLGERMDIEWTVEMEAGDQPNVVPSRFDDENWIEGFDIVVHHFSYSRVAADDQAELTERLAGAHRDTGVPAVVIHGTMHFGREVEQWHDFTGVETRRHTDSRPREVRNLAPEHAAMQGFGEAWTPPTVELYLVESLREGVTPLAESYDESDGKAHVVTWTHQYGEAPVFGTTLGHVNETVAHPKFLDMVAHGMQWALENADAR